MSGVVVGGDPDPVVLDGDLGVHWRDNSQRWHSKDKVNFDF